MIMINLKPPVKIITLGQVRCLYFLVVLFVIVISGVWGFLLYNEHSMESHLDQVRRQHELFKPTLIHWHHADTKQQAIATRQALLLELTQERLPLHAGIARIGAIIPEGVWLTEIRSDSNILKVSGAAKTYSSIASFLEKVQEDILFTEFSLIRTEQDKINTRFEFAVKFKEL